MRAHQKSLKMRILRVFNQKVRQKWKNLLMIHQISSNFKNLKESILMIEEIKENLSGTDREEIGLMKEIMKKVEIGLEKDSKCAIQVDQEITIKGIWNLCILHITTK